MGTSVRSLVGYVVQSDSRNIPPTKPRSIGSTRKVPGGDVTGFPSGFAVDGIDELLLRFANRPGRPLPAVETTLSMVVRAKDEPRS